MCTDCGCLIPATDHGNPAHLTVGDVQRAASASGLPLLEAAWNIPRTLAAATQDGGWPPEQDPLTHRPTLVFDVDGILAFTSEALCVALNARFGTSYSPMSQGFFPGSLRIDRLPDTQGNWIAGEMGQPGFVSTYAPDFRAIDTLTAAFDAGFECLIATERNPALQEATEQWLHEWGGPPVEVNAVGHGNKPAFMASRYGENRPAVLVDDDITKAISVPGPGVQVWMPERPWTEGVRRTGCRVYASYPVLRYWLGLGPQP